MNRNWSDASIPQREFSVKHSEMKRRSGESGSRAATGSGFARSLRGAASAALLGVSVLVASTSTLAGVPGLAVTVKSLAPATAGTTMRPIAYSAGGVAYQTAYAVQMTASTPVTVAYFYVSTGVTNPNPTNLLTAKFSPVTGLRSTDSCTLTQAETELNCVIGAIPAGGTVSFILLVNSPGAPPDGSDSILAAAWAVQSGQGKPNPSNLIHQGAEDVTLHVGSAADGVQSYMQPGQQLSVADQGSTTGVTTPEAVTVGVKQIELQTSCSNQYARCLESTVRIVDGTGNPIPFSASTPLLIDLFRAASSLKKNARIENATLSYTEVFPDGSVGTPQQIHECINGPAWEIPLGQSRCVVPAVKKATTLTFKDAAGNWHFRIIALSNGKIGW